MAENLETMLKGGHPNSLGRTLEVVELVLGNPDRFEELFATYGSADEVVRLRTSNAMKRIDQRNRALVLPYIDRFIGEVGQLDQASAQWTLAQLLARWTPQLTDPQRRGALTILKRNLTKHTDWIVLNATMETLADWSANDPDLARWLKPHLQRLQSDGRKSVAAKAAKALRTLTKGAETSN